MIDPRKYFFFLTFQQLRSFHCMVKIKNTTKNVDNILCEDMGLKAPIAMEKCGNIECPKWVATEWSPCRKSKCFAWHTALQKREVNCLFGNETVTDKCAENERPTTKQECYNELCKGVWRVEQWSEVSRNYWIIHETIRWYNKKTKKQREKSVSYENFVI